MSLCCIGFIKVFPLIKTIEFALGSKTFASNSIILIDYITNNVLFLPNFSPLSLFTINSNTSQSQ